MFVHIDFSSITEVSSNIAHIKEEELSVNMRPQTPELSKIKAMSRTKLKKNACDGNWGLVTYFSSRSISST